MRVVRTSFAAMIAAVALQGCSSGSDGGVDVVDAGGSDGASTMPEGSPSDGQGASDAAGDTATTDASDSSNGDAKDATAIDGPVDAKPGPGPLSDPKFACGGEVETAAWALWDKSGRTYLQKTLIADRLVKTGDTYALYDMQTFYELLSSMAERCHRQDRLLEMASDLLPIFSRLEPLPQAPGNTGWICKGGGTCTAANKLLDTEVQLCSVQGLGLVADVARALANSQDPTALAYVPTAFATASSHLLRWGDEDARDRWLKNATATPADVKPGSSALFFGDKTLWQIAIHANLAGAMALDPTLEASLGQTKLDELAAAMRALLTFFKARITLLDAPTLGAGVKAADLDRGFWGLYTVETRFAGYEDADDPPAVCEGNPPTAKVLIDPNTLPVVPTLGWDISHARRLVHALRALQNNRDALKSVYGLTDAELTWPELTQQFAAQWVTTIWNGDSDHPLFTNWTDGSNGWYRVAYDNGTGKCYPGYGPFFNSPSFTTGGYIEWAGYYPILRSLAATLYDTFQSTAQDDKDFVAKYYPSAKSAMQMLMFLPTLVQE